MKLFSLLILAMLMAMPAWPQGAPASKSEPEEPDFAFVSGSAYTQVKNTMQFIHQTAYSTRRFAGLAGRRNEDEFLFFQRVEYGITDRWETDFVLPVNGSRTRINGSTVASDFALADGLVGIRYRLLDEERAPLTLTMGPQMIFPSGSVEKGTGAGSAGVAWDVAASKDWGGPVFLFTTFNYHVLPRAQDTTPGSASRFVLHGADWATALGIRALERPSRGRNQDIHVFLEGGGKWEQEVEPGLASGERRGKLSWVVAPGIRYGYMTPRKTLIEIGVSAPIGLGPNGPKHGIIIQFQYEFYFRAPKPE